MLYPVPNKEVVLLWVCVSLYSRHNAVLNHNTSSAIAGDVKHNHRH